MGVEKRIKDLTTASSITNNDYLAMDNANNSAAKKTSAMPLRNVNAIANIQNNLVANKAYAIGEPFVYQGNVYQATAAIASGATITINGNCALADSLADQITALNNKLSHVGMIIQSTTLNTEAKVKAIYGSNTSWIQHSGYVLRGATSGVVANSATKTGGSDDAVVVEHDHIQMPNGYRDSAFGNPGVGNGYVVTQSAAAPNTHTQKTGVSGTNKNIPNYKSVYIWERTA